LVVSCIGQEKVGVSQAFNSMAQSKGLRNREIGRGSQWSILLGIVLALPGALLPAQTAGSQNQPQSNQSQADQSQSSQSQDQGIPDAPSTVQPPPPQSQLPQPTNPSHSVENPQENSSSSSGGATQPPPKMPPVQTVPPGTFPRNQLNPSEQGVYRLPTVSVGEVLIPVTVKYSDGRLVEGLEPKDFTVLDNNRAVKLTYFTSDAFQLSIAVVLDLGMHEITLSKVYDSLGSLAGAFSPYDEFALYTYSSTVSQQLDFTNKSQRFQEALDQIKLYPGRNNGPEALNSPFSVGPTVNGVPINGPPIAPVQTPTREAHVLNDAILRAALDLGKRDTRAGRRRVILVISDGQEVGSQASYRDVLRVLESRDIQVQAVVVGGGALPVWKQIGRVHLKEQGFWDLLPRYTKATGGGQVNSELTRNAIEDAYVRITSDVRNQYTLGYPVRSTPSSMYHSIDVLVDRRGLKVSAKDGYYPAATPR
jgi:VWFA-related protein